MPVQCLARASFSNFLSVNDNDTRSGFWRMMSYLSTGSCRQVQQYGSSVPCKSFLMAVQCFARVSICYISHIDKILLGLVLYQFWQNQYILNKQQKMQIQTTLKSKLQSTKDGAQQHCNVH